MFGFIHEKTGFLMQKMKERAEAGEVFNIYE